MGIDEIKLLGRPRCIITNLKERTVVELLRSRRKKTVAAYLFRLPNRGAVEYVCMDMWNPHRQAVQAVLPQAVIVIDKLHVVRMPNAALDTVRKELRASLTPKQRRTLKHARFILLRRGSELESQDRLILEVWTDRFPILGVAYRLKEEFYDIYEAESREEALECYCEWCDKVTDDVRPAFQDILTALDNWEPEIFAHFDAPGEITNGYTEAMNGIAKLTNRLGRGYSFDAIRTKVLYNSNFHERRPLYERGMIMAERVERIKRPDLLHQFVYQPPIVTTQVIPSTGCGMNGLPIKAL